MPTEITPQKVNEAVRTGFKRLENFRNARLMFLRAFAGQYYDQDHGSVGTEPLNLIFNAISVHVPNLVMANPKHTVTSKFLAYRPYAELLGLALDENAKDTQLRDTLRRWIVDALFTIGIMKTGLCESNSAIYFDDTDQVDPGEIYTETIDFDDFVLDPCARRIKEAAFIGHRIRMPRQTLLDSGLYANDIIERLPASRTGDDDGAADLSRQSISREDTNSLYDLVDLVELWVPQAKALITLPGSDVQTDKYLRVADYYGPDTGPYTFLSLTPPMPDNPMPIAPVGIWYDLHIRANRMAAKVIDQAERQKDVLGYKRSAADDAQSIVDSSDGETIALDSPKEDIQIYSFGGQRQSNEAHVQQLMMWFNLVSGNVEALGGIRSDAATATQAQILQANGSIRIEDLKDLVYTGIAQEAEKRAWYLHTDPLIDLPLIRRKVQSAQFAMGLTGVVMTSPAQMVEEQVFLTPEARQGDFLDYNFTISPKSMTRMDNQMRAQRMMEFAVKLLPAAAQAAMVCQQMGVPFSFPKFVTRMAAEYDIEWLDEVFYDPEFQQMVAAKMAMMPQAEGSKGPANPTDGGISQNGQPGQVAAVAPGGEAAFNQQAQVGAVPMQAEMGSNQAY